MRKPKAWGQSCPNPTCASYRLINRGNVSAISTYLTQSGKRRIFRCKDCERTFSETRETVFFDLRTSEEKVIMALKMLLGKGALSAMGFVLGVTEATVLEWLRRAAHKAQAIHAHLLRDRSVTEVQLDEMWSFIRRKHAQQAETDGESPELSEDGRQWVWISVAPAFYTFARPHLRLGLPLPDQAPHTSGLMQPKWHHRTPGMAAGLTDHVWTFRELLTATCEPIHHQSGSG